MRKIHALWCPSLTFYGWAGESRLVLGEGGLLYVEPPVGLLYFVRVAAPRPTFTPIASPPEPKATQMLALKKITSLSVNFSY